MPLPTLIAAPSNRRAVPTGSHLTAAIDRARHSLLALQYADGHWVGELQGDTILESEYILLMAFLGREEDVKVSRAANYLWAQRLPNGGWSNYPGGPTDISVTVKGYFALKIASYSADDPWMQQTATLILQMGGAERSNSFTRFYLALLGQFPYANCPTVPPELMLLPRWFPINIYAMSAWSRTIFVPLSLVSAQQPVRQLTETMSIRELFAQPPETPRPACDPQGWLSWTNFFLGIDRLMKFAERNNLLPMRRLATRKALEWMRAHSDASDGIGAIFPPMVYHLIVLRTIGVADDAPEFVWAMKQVEDLMIEDGDTLRLQPCLSPVWDTSLATIAIADGPNRPAIDSAVQWMLDREIREPGDYSQTNPHLEPGGWCFEYQNRFYPDTDDTSMVLIAMARAGSATSPKCRGAVYRAVNWLIGMQNDDGGWAAFDRNINLQILEKVPFADHNAMLDPSCPDITARVLESLSYYGYRVGQKPVEGALKFLFDTQEPDGSWKGRWGVNYIYGTWQVLVGLERIGYDMSRLPIRKAASWLKQAQNADGGWGESCRSYDDPAYAGVGESTASQTAWALLGLLAAGEFESECVQVGIHYLLGTQNADGAWDEAPFTGTGFPKVFYLKYHLYPHYFPLMALSRYARECATS